MPKPQDVFGPQPGQKNPDPRSVYGSQLEPARDSLLGSYGYAKQRQLGVLKDQVAALGSALQGNANDAHQREEVADLRFDPARPEVIDPRGVTR